MKRTDFHELLKALSEGGVEFVVVGGVAAVLGGAPVATLDLDVVYPAHEPNLRRLAKVLSALRGCYRDPAGRVLRPTVERLRENRVNLLVSDLGLLDAMQEIGDGWRFEDLQEKSTRVRVGDLDLLVLGLEAVVESKRAAGREKDRAMLPVLLRTLEERGEK